MSWPHVAKLSLSKKNGDFDSFILVLVNWLLIIRRKLITERRREASVLHSELGGHVRDKYLRRNMGVDCRVWVRWMGEYDQFCETSRHIRVIRQVLPVQTGSGRRPCTCAVAAPALIFDFPLLLFFLSYFGISKFFSFVI